MLSDPLTYPVANPLPNRWWSIDPGDVNVGWCTWSGQECVSAVHTDPDTLVDTLVGLCVAGSIDLVVYEKFQLFGWKMGEQQGSEFQTAELIGAMKHVCRRAQVPMRRYRPVDHKARYKMMRNMPPQRKVRDWISYGHGSHAKDAENLGEYHVDRVLRKTFK